MAPKQTKKATTKKGGSVKQAKANRAARVLHAIVTELAGGRGTKAVRLFMDAESHGLLPKGPKLTPWLMKAVGKATVARLTAAWATFPCFYCKKGLEQCLRCGGVGSTSERALCDDCLGQGLTRCDCCAGSGWITVNCVPIGFRAAVVTERTRLAQQGLSVLLAKPLPKPSERNPAASLKRSTQQLLAVNRFLGVLENTVVELKNLQAARSLPASKIASLLKVCVKYGAAGEARVRELLSSIAAAACLEAKTTKADTDARRLSLQWAEEYTNLAKSRELSDTMLGHPFLRRVVKKSLAQLCNRSKPKTKAAAKKTPANAANRRS